MALVETKTKKTGASIIMGINEQQKEKEQRWKRITRTKTVLLILESYMDKKGIAVREQQPVNHGYTNYHNDQFDMMWNNFTPKK